MGIYYCSYYLLSALMLTTLSADVQYYYCDEVAGLLSANGSLVALLQIGGFYKNIKLHKTMKLEYTDACCYTTLTVDDKETIDLTDKKFKSVLKKMIDNIGDIAVLQSTFIHIMESMGEYKDLGKCGQCGDYNSKYTWEIP